MKRTTLILFSYSVIDNVEKLDAFYQHLLGRYYSKEHAEAGEGRFRDVGFPDPLTFTTERIREALEKELSTPNNEWRVVIGAKHSPPFLDDVIREAVKDSDEIKTLPLTPLHSTTGVTWYEKKIDRIASTASVPVKHLGTFGDDERFIKLLEKRLKETLHWLGENRRDAHILFTSHSMPGLRNVNKDFIDSYEELVHRLMESFNPSYSITYRSGRPAPEKWLGPDVKDVCKEVLDEAPRPIVAFEIMSIIENVEAINEVGKDIRNITDEYGVPFIQVPYINDSFDFVQYILDYVRED